MDKGLIKLVTYLIDGLMMLIKQYEESEIDYKMFSAYSETKIVLLKNYVNIPS